MYGIGSVYLLCVSSNMNLKKYKYTQRYNLQKYLPHKASFSLEKSFTSFGLFCFPPVC